MAFNVFVIIIVIVYNFFILSLLAMILLVYFIVIVFFSFLRFSLVLVPFFVSLCHTCAIFLVGNFGVQSACTYIN